MEKTSTSRGQKRKHQPSPPTKNPYEWYRIKNSKFYALIINVVRDRPGAEHDSTALKKLLPSCNFNMMMCTDLSPNGIKKSIADFKSELKSKKGNIDGSIVALMSHGTKDEWFSTSIPQQRLSLYDDIVDQLNRKNCPYLDDVPKIFLVNVCKGKVEDPGCVGSNDTDENDSSDSTNPELFKHFGKDFEMDDSSSSISGSSWKDTLICYASYRDCKAYRNTGGTRFIQAFCEIVDNQKRPTDIDNILRQVSDKLSKIPRKREKGFFYQTPCFLNVGYHRNLLYLARRETGGSRRESLKSLQANFLHDSKKRITWPITHGLLTNAGNFSGRDKELEQLKNYFKSKEQLVLVCGIAGIGKTELCRKFANDICLKNNNVSCIWLHGEKVDTLTESVRDVAKNMGIPEDEKNEHLLDYFGLIVKNILENSDRLLLVVIDNVDEEYKEVISIINTRRDFKNKRMFILVTSRYSAVLGSTKNSITLDVLSAIEATDMLQTSIEGLSDSAADKLGKLVQYFPLVLQQAVAFIIQERDFSPNYSVSQFVSEFDKKKEAMLGHKLEKLEHDYEKTTLVVWNMTFEKIKLKCKDAGEILKILAHLNPEDIELDFLEIICRRRKLDFDKGFNIIHKYCIVKLDANVDTKMYSIHRLLQDVLRENSTQEYARALFDDVFFVSVERKAYVRYGRIIDSLESLHLQSVCKYLNLKWVSDSHIHFEEALLIAVELNRLDCALECIKLVYPHLIDSNPTELSEEMKVEFVKKFFLWYVINDSSYNVTKEMVMNGEYVAHFGHYYKSVNLIEGALKISIKYFGENSTQHFLVINKQVRKVRYKDIEKAMKLCEGFRNFQYDREKILIYFDTIFTILKALDKKRSVENQQVEKIVDDFSKIHPKSVELVGLLEAIIFDFKEDYAKAHDLIKQYLPQLEENNRELIKWWYEDKELELKIKTIDFDKSKREEIEREFGEIYYNKLSLRGLEKIEQLFEVNFGRVDPLTVKVKVAVASKLWDIDKEKCLQLCEFVLNSRLDTYYGSAFRNFCYAKNIDDNYDEQKVILEKLLVQKESLGENNSNLIRLKQLLANTMEKFSDLRGALELFEHVKKYAVDCGWSEKDLKKSRSDVARLKLKVGDFNDIKTREDIYREFGGFNDYRELSLEQMQKILTFYENVLGNDDKLTWKVKWTARRL